MRNRVLHPGVWSSERFVELGRPKDGSDPSPADYARGDTLRCLFLALVSASDDLSNAEATTPALSVYLARAVSRQQGDAWIAELSTADLVRPYLVDGKRYVHIPRSRQRLRSMKGAYPRPPNTLEDNEITSKLDGQTTDERRTIDGQTTDTRQALDRSRAPAEVKRSEEKRREVKRSEGAAATPEQTASDRAAVAEKAHELAQRFKVNGHSETPPKTAPAAKAGWWTSEKGIADRALELDMPANPGESYRDWASRIFDADKRAKRAGKPKAAT